MMTGEGSIDARFAVLLSSEEGSGEEKKTDDSAEGQGGPLEALELAQRGSAKSPAFDLKRLGIGSNLCGLQSQTLQQTRGYADKGYNRYGGGAGEGLPRDHQVRRRQSPGRG
ncbi:hypothetical protein JG688_00009536 [Phytophthora aleatoria]|uniref:Uncharacterized protein n=1 Tax=Phytophthora aleatoria TaxID=2496075 RepID=A0A8J5IRB6_9STRA|nr:hypothetical protein JG688_00009536 [Phytophthora aleatoria]